MPEAPNKRPIRSYIRREGRLTSGQEKALKQIWPQYGIEPGDKLLDLPVLFGNDNPVILEIGFGNGELLAYVAQQHPDRNYLGIEVHRPGIGRLLLSLKENGIDNIRIASQDAIEVLDKLIPENSLQQLWLFFPDPWPKKKHHKRRIVSQQFLDLAAHALAHNGLLHMATDWQDYADHMKTVLAEDKRFKAISALEAQSRGAIIRPSTKFERRGQSKGHHISDHYYQLIKPV